MQTGDDMNRIAFGRRLNAIRTEQQITAEKLAEMCEISAIFIRQIERADRLPSLPVFVRMCNELHVDPHFFLDNSLIWNEDDEITALNEKLRALSPHQFSLVMDTVNLLIDRLSEQL